MSFPTDTQPKFADTWEITLKKILAALRGTSDSPGSLPVSGGDASALTPNSADIGTGDTEIPADSKEWSIIIYTGEATLSTGGTLKAGAALSSSRPLAVHIVVTPGDGCTGFAYWAT